MRVCGWTLNGIWSFVKPCLQASRFLLSVLKRVKDSPPLQAKCSGRVTLLPGSELWPVSFNERQQTEEAFFQKHSWRAHVSSNFPSFPCGKHCFQWISFCFQDANYGYATRQGIWTKIRASEQLEKFCEHEQAGTHLSFASNSSKGQILRALSNWMAPFDTPFICWLSSSVGVVLICFLNTLPQARNKANKILDRLNIFFKLCSLLPYQLCKCHNICRWTFLGSYNKVHPPPSTSLHLDRDNSHRDHLIH